MVACFTPQSVTFIAVIVIIIIILCCLRSFALLLLCPFINCRELNSVVIIIVLYVDPFPGCFLLG